VRNGTLRRLRRTRCVRAGGTDIEPAARCRCTPTEKTVEQVQKNIKVLKRLAGVAVDSAMNFMSASLGVRCTYCHVNKDNKWDFVSDEKPEKNTAREMIKMVLAVNKDHFSRQH